MNLVSFYSLNARNHFCRKATIENNQYSKLLTLISNSYLIRQSFRGFRILYLALPSLHCGSYEITLTVRLKGFIVALIGCLTSLITDVRVTSYTNLMI